MAIKFYLQPNPITPDPNDQSARVLANQTLDQEALVALVLKRGTLVTETDLRAVLTIFFDEVSSQIADGNTVLLPLVNIRPSIKGVFTNVTDTFDDRRHTKKASLSAGTLLVKKMAEAKVEKVTGYQPSPELLEYFDINTQTNGSMVTPHGIGRIIGSELKFNANNDAEGLFFIAANGTETKVTVFATRSEGLLLFNIPDGLTAGSYSLELRKGYGAAANIRKGVLNDALTVA